VIEAQRPPSPPGETFSLVRQMGRSLAFKGDQTRFLERVQERFPDFSSAAADRIYMEENAVARRPISDDLHPLLRQNRDLLVTRPSKFQMTLWMLFLRRCLESQRWNQMMTLRRCSMTRSLTQRMCHPSDSDAETEYLPPGQHDAVTEVDVSDYEPSVNAPTGRRERVSLIESDSDSER